MRIYLAGKINGSTWRSDIVPNYKALSQQATRYFYDHSDWPGFEKAIFGQHDLVGPYFGGYNHTRNTHGAGNHRGDFMAEEIVSLCMKSIHRADLIFAWIDSLDTYGTIFELGYAKGLGKHIRIGNPGKFPDMWFVYEGSAWNSEKSMWDYYSDEAKYKPQPGLEMTPRYALQLCLETPEMLKALPYKEYLNSTHWKHLRDRMLWRAGNACQVCNSPNNLNVHHRTYERRGQEEFEDLIVLCRRCHILFHSNGKIVDSGSWNK